MNGEKNMKTLINKIKFYLYKRKEKKKKYIY